MRKFNRHRSRHETLRNRLDELNAILELLLGYGVDAGYMDMHEL